MTARLNFPAPSLVRLRQDVIADIQAQIEETKQFDILITTRAQMTAHESKESSWSRVNEELLLRAFNNASILQEYQFLDIKPPNPNAPLSIRIDDFNERVAIKVVFLQTTLKRLKFIPELSTISPPISSHPAIPQKSPSSTEVFLVHGHDEAAKQSVARFLETLGLVVTILHEKPNQGRTIIEKLEQQATAATAVVLLTPDDVGATQWPKTELRPRARQNVIFEMGFFTGKLQRSHVLVLHSEDVEIPTDYSGVLYIPLDKADSWKYKLLRELQALKLPINTERLP